MDYILVWNVSFHIEAHYKGNNLTLLNVPKQQPWNYTCFQIWVVINTVCVQKDDVIIKAQNNFSLTFEICHEDIVLCLEMACG